MRTLTVTAMVTACAAFAAAMIQICLILDKVVL